ncbi:HupE/UreJ family protein (plasmid) [Ensifer sp. PDNC004]|uniref:HupE/UreJ family protein n=1 Tax=Ensifer sp. PDNC004 TaxID=2811423 RepID=UPI0019629C04|nr:HupE/UreJ family protein [Ensifer sp. PDNC004]QRY70523.1 HupE/UreJ family protein [Ensifer sp. PDNC004]
MRKSGALLAFPLLLLFGAPALAHEVRPAFLDIRETAPDAFAVLWKVPAQGRMRLALDARLPRQCIERARPVRSFEGSAYLERWTVDCAGGLRNSQIAIDGLKTTLTEALVRIGYQNGGSEVGRLMPDAPSFTVAGAQTSLEVARTYFLLGVEHIMLGFDHLIFVLALMLLIRDRFMLFKTITAFTVAHSITLAGASLGYFSLPQKPVEATVALSIAFVASELLKARPNEVRLSEAYPWVVAFAFGLLHGFGFSGALKEIGLPQSDVPISLLTFNLGVEAGQIIFVVTALAIAWVARALLVLNTSLARQAIAYGIGTSAMLWFIPRVATMAI